MGKMEDQCAQRVGTRSAGNKRRRSGAPLVPARAHPHDTTGARPPMIPSAWLPMQPGAPKQGRKASTQRSKRTRKNQEVLKTQRTESHDEEVAARDQSKIASTTTKSHDSEVAAKETIAQSARQAIPMISQGRPAHSESAPIDTRETRSQTGKQGAAVTRQAKKNHLPTTKIRTVRRTRRS